MRPSIILTSTFAFLSSASPQLLDRAGKSPCRKAIEKGPKPRVGCSSFLRTTVTPCPKTKITTTTSTTTVTKRATSAGTGSVSTTTKLVTVYRDVITYVEVHAPSRTAQAKRAGPTCPSSFKPTNIPIYARKQCNRKQYATACSNMGIKRRTTTLAARTVVKTNTATATASKTITDVVLVSPTGIVTVTSTTTYKGGSTSTAFAAATQSCFRLADASTNKEVSVNSGSLYNLEASMVENGKGSKFSLTDEEGQYGYVFIGANETVGLAYGPVFGYSRPDPVFAYVGEKGLDALEFTRYFYSDAQSLICEIDAGSFKCTSNYKNQMVTRTEPQSCQVANPGDPTQMYWRIAFTTPGYVSKYCTPLTLKLVSC